MPINFHSSDNKYTYTNRQATDSWTHMIQNIVDVKEKRVIDIGCGGGIYTKQLALMGAEVIGVDFSNQMIQAAKENCTHISNASFTQGDAYNIPFADETFDIVLSRAVIHHLDHIPKFFQEAYRILKRNGILILQDRTIEDCTIPGSPEHIRGYFFSCYPKLIHIEAKRRPETNQILHLLRDIGFYTNPIQNFWEVRKIHSSIKDLLQDLSPRTGRSILHELSDNELSELLQHIHSKLYENSPIIEQDRWTIWTAVKE
ncbi:class I SAM-dependent methyltransferase [Bacillus sp. 123MFChir2]|uniref:class I SAM-dependent methyltransferase n=1 Tax=Bacillus sp. 123MFChir2 TaxID=1169144 RepID=UPI00036FAAE2|nr:class I SAM-dependent methyltransferase [Bacillus sp. 123MFChir2]